MTSFALNRQTCGALPAAIVEPSFDLANITPGIVHIGLGGFHRAHMARYTHDLMAADPNARVWGIVGAGLRASDRPLLDALHRQDGLYTLVERENQYEARTLIASIIRTIDASNSSDKLLDAIDDPAIRIVSLTVSENGYHIDGASKKLNTHDPAIQGDIAHPRDPHTAVGILAEAYRRRFLTGREGFTALSCDNIQHNGNVLRDAVLTLARETDPSLADWIERYGAFPSSMVDRITPIPTSGQIHAFNQETGLHDDATLFCERFCQWVVEDRFATGRPQWEAVGAQFVNDVTPYELMKLRLLNTSHLAIAGLGELRGYETVAETMADPLIRRYMSALMNRETEPTLLPVAGIDLETYKQNLITRFANPAIRDTNHRINTDAPINLLIDPIRDRLRSGTSLELLALGLAAWFRRVRGEEGNMSTVAMHPLGQLLKDRAMEGGDDPRPLLSIEPLFGDLSKSERLRGAVARWLTLINHNGVAAVLQEAAAGGFF